VIAENAEGKSMPSNSSNSVVIRDPIYPPGEPKHLKVTDTTKSSITCMWQPPTYDGGSEVQIKIFLTKFN